MPRLSLGAPHLAFGCMGVGSAEWFWETASWAADGDEDGWKRPRVHIDASLLPWDAAEGTDRCDFWNGTFEWSLGLCSHFAISRIGSRIESQAVERAAACPARPDRLRARAEVGVGLPALFVYDATQGMRMLLAPRMLERETLETDGVDVRVHDPSGDTGSRVVPMSEAVRVEFLTTSSKALQIETLYGVDAFCVQLVRHAISQACWDALD